MRFRVASVVLLLIAAVQLPSQQPAGNIEFSRRVQPIFTENCAGCHKGAGAPAGLQLDSAAGALKGSSSGAVIVPGNSRQSLLVQRISDTSGRQMPPGGALSKDLIRIVADWIDQGAKTDAPATAGPKPALPEISMRFPP
jgi:mono/diheme cytochrome c family protein